MASSRPTTTDELHSEDDSVVQSSRNSEGQPRESTPFYFGGPLFGIPTYEQPREHITQDGRRVIFDVKPPSVGIGGSSINAERRENTLLSSLDLFLAAETYAADEQLTLRSPTRSSTMSSNSNNENLHLLADVALGTYVQGGQRLAQTAPAQGSSTANTQQPAERQAVRPPRAEEATINLTPAEQPVTSASNEWGVLDDNPPQDGQQPTQVSTQGANSVINTSTSPPAEQQPAQTAPSQTSTAINSTAAVGGLASANPRRLPPATGQRSGLRSGRQFGLPSAPEPVVRQAPKSKPRTTGFDKTTGKGMLTKVCGIVTPAKGTPVKSTNRRGPFCCPRCASRFTRSRTVKDHFITCVGKYGNPNGLSWYDHRTLQKARGWYDEYLPPAKEVGDGDEEVEEEDKEEGMVSQTIESDVAAGEEDHDGDSRMGEEDQGRDPGVPSDTDTLFGGEGPDNSNHFYDDDGDSMMG